jgi:hypothetical protein
MLDLAIAENTNISLPVEEDLALWWTHIGNKQEQGVQPKAIHRFAYGPTSRVPAQNYETKPTSCSFSTAARRPSRRQFVCHICPKRVLPGLLNSLAHDPESFSTRKIVRARNRELGK